jgi:3-oxoacyl-[acyl-carrier-protein] synthase I
MAGQPLNVISTGMVSSVGLNGPAACAAIRAKLTNPSQTHFKNAKGEWIMSHAAALEQPWRGIERLAQMAASVAAECLADVPRDNWPSVAVLLCTAETTRSGRPKDFDEQLYAALCHALGGVQFASAAFVPRGRVSVGVALMKARQILYESKTPAVLIVGADSLLTSTTLRTLDEQGRLLAPDNSNGFIPGEGAAGLLVTRVEGDAQFVIEGLGFGMEQSHIDSEAPLRADGLSTAIKASLAEAGREMFDVDYRIADLSGEHYYFKEAALALTRTLHKRKEDMDLWHPAECIGEAGSVIGPAMIAVARAAAGKTYAPGPNVLIHAANDAGERVAIVARGEAR